MDLTLSNEHLALIDAMRSLLARTEARAARFADETPPTSAARARVLEMVSEFGLGQLDIVTTPTDLLSAALIVEECGAASAAAPFVQLVLGVATHRDGLVYPVGRKHRLMLNHLDLGHEAIAVDIEGRLHGIEILEESSRPARVVVPSASRVSLRPADAVDQQVTQWIWAAGVTLIAFGALGQINAAVELAIEHVSTREQFGRPLSHFQSVRNRIADLVIARNGLSELCHYTLWRLHAKPQSALIDALLLRRLQTRTSRKAMLSSHQLHGAMGYCYEYPLVGLTLSAEYDRHVPLSESECLHELVQRWGEIDLHYDEDLAPAWPRVRTDQVSRLEPDGYGLHVPA
jgi:hypothetical protein